MFTEIYRWETSAVGRPSAGRRSGEGNAAGPLVVQAVSRAGSTGQNQFKKEMSHVKGYGPQKRLLPKELGARKSWFTISTAFSTS